MNRDEAIQHLENLIWDMEHGYAPDFGVIEDGQVGTTPIVTMQDGEIYAYDAPVFAYWDDGPDCG